MTLEVRRVLLIRHGATSAVRAAAFACDDPLEPAARSRAQRLASSLPAGGAATCGPEQACRQTALSLGLTADAAPQLAGCDIGRWAGRTLEDVQKLEPADVAAWLSDPNAAPHGGESLTDVSRRVGEWMEQAASGSGWLTAVVDATVVRAAICRALEAPLSAFWRVDIAPLNVTELHARGGRWTVRNLNCHLACREGLRYGATAVP